MVNKQTSFLAPFLATFLSVSVLGLCILYFGYYQTRLEHCRGFIVEVQSKPTPEVALSFTVDDTGVNRGIQNNDSQVTPDESSGKESKADSGKKPRSAQKVSTPLKTKTEQKRSTCGSSGTRKAKPINRKSRRPSQSRKTRFNKTEQDSDHDNEISPVNRGPAFPSSRTDEDDSGFSRDEDESDREIPDINDPEMDDNPLIRALREASKRSQENPRDPDEKPVNPFEAILNNSDR